MPNGRRPRPPSPSPRARPRRPRSPSWPPAPRTSPDRKAAITSSFSAAGIWPCSRPSRRPGEHLGRQPLELLDGRPGHHPLGPLHQRADHVGPVAGGHLGRAPAPRRPASSLGVAGPDRRDRRAAGRQLVEHRHVEVAEDHHGGGARDRGGRHDQQDRDRRRVRRRRLGDHRRAALLPQRRPLLDPEPVLLVDDHHAERAERAPPRSAARGCRPRCRPRPERSPWCSRVRSAAGGAVGEQRDGDRPLAAEPRFVGDGSPSASDARTTGEVLLGQHLGRHHQGALVARPGRPPASRPPPPRSCPSPTSP